MKKLFGLAALFAAFAFALAFVGCSSGTDGLPVVIVTPGDSSSGGGTNNGGGGTDNGGGQQTGGGQTTTPAPAKYTITFNANDQSENPATDTQTFTAGTPQNLKTIASLGFAKDGCHFAGWLTAADGAEASYADGAAYTATVDATLYAKWSAIPVYSANIPVNARGTVTASPATAREGTEITLSASPFAGYEFLSYTVTDADGAAVPVSNGKFTMPASDVTVAATFKAISYSVNIGTVANGSVTASKSSACVGEEITLGATANEGYEFVSFTVTDADSNVVTVTNGKFTMPAKNVTVTATFSAINYNINIGTFANGSVSASPATATIGQTVTLTASPETGYKLDALTVTAEGGSVLTTSGTGNTRTFEMPAQNVTVSATFLALGPGDYKKVGEVTIESTTYDIVTFGLWPQTIIASGVTVDKNTCQKEPHGAFTYCKGSDGEWYVEQAEKAYGDNYKYSDGTTVAKSSAGSKKWFKVEPIKWRVLTDSYGGNKLLLAESILTGGVQYYLKVSSRTIGGATVYANNYKYSTIRAWLNGSYEADDTQDKTHAGKGFLQSAFTAAQQAAIKTTTVDNSAASTTDTGNNITQSTSYKCDNTSDKIFLLSEKEVTTSAYGFAAYDSYGAGNNRIRVTTDFAKATGEYQDSRAGMGGYWRLRSPSCCGDTYARDVFSDGDAVDDHDVNSSHGGIAPALCVAGSGGGQTVPTTYTVTMPDSIANGTVTSNKSTAIAGETVTLTVSPSSGYKLASVIVTAADGSSVSASGTGNARTFMMPAQNVKVTATFSAINYTVSCRTSVDGTVTSNKSTAIVGETVTLTANPERGYKLASVTVTAADGSSVYISGSGNTRTFYMPAQNVTVRATFSEISSGGSSGSSSISNLECNYVCKTLGARKITLTWTGSASKLEYKYGSYTFTIDGVSGQSVTLCEKSGDGGRYCPNLAYDNTFKMTVISTSGDRSETITVSFY